MFHLRFTYVSLVPLFSGGRWERGWERGLPAEETGDREL